MWGKKIFFGMLQNSNINLKIYLNLIYFKYILIILNNICLFK
jgi:hypothetical protein